MEENTQTLKSELCKYKTCVEKIEHLIKNSGVYYDVEDIINIIKDVDTYTEDENIQTLKQQLDLYKTWYRAKHDDVNNIMGSYYKKLYEINQLTKDKTDEISSQIQRILYEKTETGAQNTLGAFDIPIEKPWWKIMQIN